MCCAFVCLNLCFSQMGTLEVVIPPDILNDNESTEGGGVALEGGTVRLKCHAVGVPSPTVLWRREDSKSLVFRNETSREKQGKRDTPNGINIKTKQNENTLFTPAEIISH